MDCISELKDKNLIDDALMEQAAHQSNIDAMAQQQAQAPPEEQIPQVQETPQAPQPQNQVQNQMQSQIQSDVPPADMKVLKLATLAMIFRQIKQDKVQSILNKFNSDDANSVIKFMDMEDLDEKVDPKAAMRCVQEIRTALPHTQSISPATIVTRIQNVSQYFDKSQLESALRRERAKVKKFVFTALEGEFYEMAPRVANIIATHLEDSV